ncbi:branched-chain amino acid ABC transporter permease [Lysinibacillus endophyticus]|uniref:Branched-chain amino acid ABC transporter permease n=1 Tax=Ureibacillus endophyticus TaxID=1978490 RepID=A0A494Z3D7_9BACL|nr:branched-chain amino acid ABC transporter permease [Lysinibacillus endophyticus]MCP1146248.1 branched-chain amino acid ABC transporter permease [Lysinibacillus endophyticus]RKQ17037.1 branched-chain amino acid ABC transporter permease [Lysinibacillus endophyticus]
MELLSQMMQLLFSGLTLGAIYALIAVGFVVIYNVTGILNFAQGEFAMLGALTCISLVNNNVPLWLAIILSIVIVAAIGGIFERTALHTARKSSVTTLIIITIGVSIVLRGAAILIWGTQVQTLPPFTDNTPITILDAVLLPQNIWAVGISIVILILMMYFFNYTFVGKSLTACVVNPFAARLMGINPEKMSLFAVIVSAGVGALAGTVIAPISGATYDMGMMLGIKAFVAAVIGGLTNAPAAIAGAFLIGILEAFTEGLWSSGLKDVVTFTFLLLILFVKPEGLFAKASGKRV